MKVERSDVAVCALVSGGLDSCVMLAELAAGRICHSDPAEAGEESLTVHPVFIRHGLVWEKAELRHLRRFLHVVAASPARGPSRPPRRRFAATIHAPAFRRFYAPRSTLHALTILSLPLRDIYGAHWSTTGHKVPHARTPDDAVYLPGRNLLLLSKAAVFCAERGIPIIAVGSLGHNPFADATPKFFRDFSAAASAGLNCRLKIIAPFRTLTKEQVIRRGARLNLPLHLSFSCIAPRRGLHCGHCNKCAERQQAFRRSGVMDKTSYL